MISRLRPMDAAISFRERTYRIGESIDLTIELTPHRDCHVREGRVDLMVEERWTERSTMSYEKPVYTTSSGARGGASIKQIGTTTETKQVVVNHKETSAHSSVMFLESVRLVSGTPARYNVRLEIQPEPPSHTVDAKLKWWLQTVVDVVGARDIKPRSKMSIAV